MVRVPVHQIHQKRPFHVHPTWRLGFVTILMELRWRFDGFWWRGAKRRVIHNLPLYLVSRSTLCPALPCVPLYLARPSTLPPRVRLKTNVPKAPREPRREAPRSAYEARSAE